MKSRHERMMQALSELGAPSDQSAQDILLGFAESVAAEERATVARLDGDEMRRFFVQLSSLIARAQGMPCDLTGRHRPEKLTRDVVALIEQYQVRYIRAGLWGNNPDADDGNEWPVPVNACVEVELRRRSSRDDNDRD